MSFDSRGLATLPERRPVVALVLAALACIAVGASGSVFTAAGLASWYPGW